MNFTADADRDKMSFVLLPEAPLTWAAFGFETSSAWFMSRSIFAMEFERKDRYYDSMDGIPKFLFLTRPLTPQRGAMEFSNITSFEDLMKSNVLPPTLADKWRMPAGVGTLIDTKIDIRSRATIGLFAHTVSEIVIDLFCNGATIVRTQTSFSEFQIWANVSLPPEAFVGDRNGFKLSETLEKLPWPVAKEG